MASHRVAVEQKSAVSPCHVDESLLRYSDVIYQGVGSAWVTTRKPSRWKEGSVLPIPVYQRESDRTTGPQQDGLQYVFKVKGGGADYI
jgi:hypothetical protein